MKNSDDDKSLTFPEMLRLISENNKKIVELQKENNELMLSALSGSEFRRYIVDAIRTDMHENGQQYA